MFRFGTSGSTSVGAPSHGSRADMDGGGVSQEERTRLKRRRQMAKKTPEQRRNMLRYERRHNEKDGRLFYCDYCDLFVSSSAKPWRRHLTSAKHLEAFEAYWSMAMQVECVWMKEIQDGIDRARAVAELQARGGPGVVRPAVYIGAGIVVGGSGSAPGSVVSAQPPPLSVVVPTIKVGDNTVYTEPLPVIRVGDKVVTPVSSSSVPSQQQPMGE